MHDTTTTRPVPPAIMLQHPGVPDGHTSVHGSVLLLLRRSRAKGPLRMISSFLVVISLACQLRGVISSFTLDAGRNGPAQRGGGHDAGPGRQVLHDDEHKWISYDGEAEEMVGGTEAVLWGSGTDRSPEAAAAAAAAQSAAAQSGLMPSMGTDGWHNPNPRPGGYSRLWSREGPPPWSVDGRWAGRGDRNCCGR